MNDTIQKHWFRNELPGLDCIVKGDGSIIIFNFYKTIQDNKIHYYFSPLCDTTIESLEKYNDDIWTEIEVNSNQKALPNGEAFLCGEGGMGNEGFIACVARDKQTLIWALFCTGSNPFQRIELGGYKITAYSTNNYKFIIDIDKPENIKIEVY